MRRDAGNELGTDARNMALPTRQAAAQAGSADPEPHEVAANEDTNHRNGDAGQQAMQSNTTEAPSHSRRTSNRERRPRDMYGDWDTSQRGRQTGRATATAGTYQTP